ncbi:MAG: ATPase [Verrucomicrobiales bacterium]|nr:ATPase [Verrucomicrobiales bacterium]|tara:strand:+ start:447 stop:881 length:435 start_codon:yes stop_codon:yes gene_type:complete
MTKDEAPVVVEQTFDLPAEKVWKAITELDQMHGWYFKEIPEFRAEVGFETVFDVSCGERVFPHAWKILEVVPNEKIVYTWRFAGYEGDGFVSFDLAEAEGKTTLTVTCTTTEDFQADIPEFNREACVGGWNYFIKENLAKFLAG